MLPRLKKWGETSLMSPTKLRPCHHVPLCSRKTQSAKYHSNKSVKRINGRKCDMRMMAVRIIMAILRNQEGTYTKISKKIEPDKEKT